MLIWICDACLIRHEVPEDMIEYRDCLAAEGDAYQVATHEDWTYVEHSDITL